MYFYLFDRSDRLGANIINYITQLLFAYNNNYFIEFYKEKENYRYYDSFFVKTLFNYIEKHNEKLLHIDTYNTGECQMNNEYKFNVTHDYITVTSNVLKDIKTDFITFF
jgi:hypothetical protein